MATITYMTFLMHGTGTGTLTWADLCPIKDYPDLENTINAIDVTDLQQGTHTYIMGLKDSGGDMAFTANYDKTSYSAIKALEGTEQNMALWFGGTEAADGTVTPTGSDGKWEFKGYVSVGIVGKGADEAREMQIHVTPTSVPAFT